MPPDLEGHGPQSPVRLGLHHTQNSELDPSLGAVLPIEGDAGVEAAVFHSHWADDQRAIRLLMVSGDQTESGALSHWGGGWRRQERGRAGWGGLTKGQPGPQHSFTEGAWLVTLAINQDKFSGTEPSGFPVLGVLIA